MSEETPDPAPPFTVPEPREQMRMVEALLFSAVAPLSADEIAKRLPRGCDVPEALRGLENHYATRGVRLNRVAGKWAFRTAADLAFLLREETTAARKLSRAAIETLSIIAYHQPATRTEIEDIRGVAVSKGTIDLLLELEWIKLGRRRETPGRPVTFVTTDVFMDHFGLESLRDLPGLEELKAAGLLDARPGPGFTATRLGADAVDDADEDTPEDDQPQGDLI